jgi:hypothetical protein
MTSRAARSIFATLAVAAAALAVTGCASPTVADYASGQPKLDLREYFNGPVTAHGMFTDRSGKIVKRFVVEMKCSWQGDIGTLDESFTYSDGTRERRVWTLTRGADGRYVGKAADVIGEATGESAGNVFRWRYTLALPVDGKVIEVQFDDWMVLIDARTMLNRAVMSKFGLRLGEVTLAFTKPAPR